MSLILFIGYLGYIKNTVVKNCRIHALNFNSGQTASSRYVFVNNYFETAISATGASSANIIFRTITVRAH